MKLKHFDISGYARFVTFCTHKKLPLLTNDVFRKIIIDAIDNMRHKYAIRLIAYVIMPEHVHLVILPSANSELGMIIGEIKRVSSKQIHNYLKLNKSNLIKKLTVIRNHVERFAFWQRRCYDHNCRTEKSTWEKVNYCHNNPVRASLVKSPELWKWSSYGWYNGDKDVVLKIDELP
jgi:putative transposase